MPNRHLGNCFCGAVELEVTGAPKAMGYCHCESCRSWSASPVNAFTLWDPADVTVVKGLEQIETFTKNPTSERHFCSKCGGHLMARHPTFKLIDVYAAILPSLPFSPQLHVNYGETVLPMKDGLQKFKDFPAELGGSGEIIEE
jgi:hypothetical protein